MGLIDILTQYDAKKKAAHAAKTVKHGVMSEYFCCVVYTALEKSPAGNNKHIIYITLHTFIFIAEVFLFCFFGTVPLK